MHCWSPNPAPTLTGPTRPIHRAAEKGNLREVTRLLDEGELVDPRDEVSLSSSFCFIIIGWENPYPLCLLLWSLRSDRSAHGQGSKSLSSGPGHLNLSSSLILSHRPAKHLSTGPDRGTRLPSSPYWIDIWNPHFHLLQAIQQNNYQSHSMKSRM
jgi:hypothetical protein